MKTVHFFAFYLHNLLKNTFFAPWSSMNPQNTKSLHFDGKGWRCSSPFSGSQSALFRCAISLFQISTSASLSFYSCFYDDLFLLLGWLAPVFMMIYSYFYDEETDYRLNPHGYSFEFVSDVDCNIFLPRIQNFQAEKIIVSSRENFMFDTRTNYIPYENEVYSRKEWSVFS